MDLRRVDLNLLVTLDVLMSERNVTAAGRRLGLSQPAVSTRLARLRALFGDRLLVTTRGGLVPTARALEMAAPLASLLAELGQLIDRTGFEPARAERRFRVVATDALHAGITAPLVARLQQDCPRLGFALLAPEGEALERRLSAGEVDLVLATPTMMPAIAVAETLFEEQFVCVLRPAHPALTSGLDLDAFCGLEHVLVSTEGGGFRGAVDFALEPLGRSRRVRTSVPNFLVVPELLAKSDMIATVPASVASLWADRLTLVEPPLELTTFPVTMGWSARSASDAGLTWLAEQVRGWVQRRGTDRLSP